ncbi:SNAP receptor activity protein [Cladophialophora chaetospira]|uniref:SNAP receptor activity protein n=1 Tax=Cladophialophora chaetospira TaxID=386627 RepID=A0AA38WWB2_9EURO|nr:SNAP receptor activity protein [Cladophialophora chaetospira]
MAESDLVATLLAVANTGTTLSIALLTFSETVATATSEIKSLARDVSLTSSILTLLAQRLSQNRSANFYSGSALQTIREAVTECGAIFKEIDDGLAKATESVARRWPKKGGKVALSAADRPKWPFLQPRVALLRWNLERVKSTLLLMVNVLRYAREKQTETEDSPKRNGLFEKTLLENLLHANQQAMRKYETLLSTVESQGESALLAKAHALYRDPSYEPELAPSVRHALKHVEHTLLQYERSAVSYDNSRVSVHIELEKDLTRSRGTRDRPTPWDLLSIVRRDQEIAPSDNDSWIPSKGEVYGSFAGGAIEGLTGDDYGEGLREPSDVRFQEQDRDSYPHHRQPQPGSSRRTDRGEGDEAVGLMHDTSTRSPQRGDQSKGQADPLASGAVKFQKGAKTRTWYSSLLDSIPSPETALSTIQKTVKNTGLFLGLEDEKEHADTVLLYRNSRLASPPGSPAAKLVRSTTFDEMLRSPSSEGTQFTPPSTIVSKEEAPETEKHADVEIKAPQPTVPVGSTPIEQKIPFLLPTEDEVGGVSGRTTPDPIAQPVTKVAGPEGTKTEASEENHALEGVEGSGTSENAGQSQDAEGVKLSKGKGKASEIAPEEPPDEIEQLLKEWTTAYE